MAQKNIWDEFDKLYNTEELAKEVEEQKESGGSFTPVPFGDYEVNINKMELTKSKAGAPMVSIWFKVVSEGEYKGSLIFYNQVIAQSFCIHKVNELLLSMDTGLDIDFKTYKQYAQLLMDMHEAIDGKLEFGLSYEEGKKGFGTYEITDVFEVE
ncbi:MAG: DUF669 domain-containing protein [Oscillospiraceae bacterium]|nr:DUF669 domain-containing protein [Oscillospiraceae bacterium]